MAVEKAARCARCGNWFNAIGNNLPDVAYCPDCDEKVVRGIKTNLHNITGSSQGNYNSQTGMINTDETKKGFLQRWLN